MIRTQRTSESKRAAGFTLVELLVVITIIAILSALTAGAVFKVIGVQRSNNTQLTIKTVSSLLDKNWAAVIRDHQNDANIPASVMTIAGNDPIRARVIWIKLNLKREFPMNLTEALTPWSLPPQIPNPPISATDLPAKPAYLAAYQRAAQISGALMTPNADQTVLAWPFESAFTLVMALQQNRGGTAFAEENFAVNALSANIFLWQGSPAQQGNAILSGPKMLVDAWGTPLVLYRWPIWNNDFLPGTSTKSSVSSGARSASFPDPLDPQGTLIDPRWNNFTNWSNGQGVWWFEKYCHTIHSGSNAQTYAPVALYTEPVIVSAGPDQSLGISPGPTLLPNGTYLTYTSGPLSGQKILAPNLPNEMNVDVTSNNAWFDNVASYKLRVGGTGDK